jgi:hypothetical protein
VGKRVTEEEDLHPDEMVWPTGALATASPSSHKGKIAARLAAAFDVASFATDIRSGRVNVATLGQPPTGRRTA